jgi:hypothetical protein
MKELKELRELAGQEVEWRRTRWLPRAYALRHGETVVAELEWATGLSGTAMARVGERTWRLARRGVFPPEIAVLEPGNGLEVGRVLLRLSGRGTFVLVGRSSYDWRRAAPFSREWGFFDLYGSPLVRVLPRFFLGRHRGRCIIEPAGAAAPELPLLLVLGVYLTIRRLKRRAAH